jgi:hypothetical protein
LVALGAVLVLGVFAGPASAASRVSYRALDGSAPKTFYNNGGLKLIGECDPGDSMTITAKTTVDDAMFHANSQGGNSGDAYFEDDNFDIADSLEFLNAGNLDALDSSSGQIEYGRPGGTNVSIAWLAEEGDGYSQARDCIFQGTARFVDSGSSYRANYRFDQPNGPTEFFNHGGLRLIGQCSPGGLSVEAKTTTDNSMIHANSQYSGNAQNALTDNDFDAADSFLLQNAVNGFLDNASGQIVYAKPGGTNVTVDWAGEDGHSALDRDCVFNGTARVRSSGDAKRVNFRVPSGDAGPTTFFSQGGLKLVGECDSGDLDVTLTTSKDHGSIHYNGQRFGTATDNENDFFGADPDDWLELFGSQGLDEEDSSGQIIYTAYSGTNVTIRYAGEETDGFSNYPCAFIGTAEVGSP